MTTTLAILISLAFLSAALAGVVVYLAFKARREIAERRRAWLALRGSEESFTSLFESVLEVVTVLKADGTIRYYSPVTERALGYAPTELIGQSFLVLVHPEDGEKVRAVFDAAIRDPDRVQSVEFQIRHKDGTWRTLESICKYLLDKSGQASVVVSSRDTTERKLLERQLVQAQKMEAVGRLAGGVAHDFNNILNNILGYSELILTDLPAESPLRRHIEEVRKAAERAAGLTGQLLAFSRRRMIEPKVFDLNQLILGMDEMIRRLIGEDIELVSRPKAPLGRVKADPGQIEQVIMNLAVNARDAMPHGGKLTLSTDEVSLDEAYAARYADLKAGSYVVFSVSDTGAGMTEEVQSHLFEPFFTTKPAGKGTGLGLATCYGIIKQAGGHISVESRPGRGTTFKVHLPRVEEEAAALPKRKEVGALPKGEETILIVEDDEPLRRLVVGVLRRQGYSVHEASNGREGLELARGRASEKIHLLLTDVIMPQMGGGELAQQVTALRPDLKVIYMSGYTDEAVAPYGVLDPKVEFLQKPFTLEALARRVREVLDKSPSHPLK